MDIKDLDKRQLILLTLLITFVVSIATGIVTVSLMNQMPKTVPQTINKIIQQTIEKVTTVEAPKVSTDDKANATAGTMLGDGDAMIAIYAIPATELATTNTTTPTEEPKALGEGIIISNMGLVLVDSSILTEAQVYKVILDKIDFDATVLKKFGNGFTILQISQKKDTTKPADNTTNTTIPTPVDNAQ